MWYGVVWCGVVCCVVLFCVRGCGVAPIVATRVQIFLDWVTNFLAGQCGNSQGAAAARSHLAQRARRHWVDGPALGGGLCAGALIAVARRLFTAVYLFGFLSTNRLMVCLQCAVASRQCVTQLLSMRRIRVAVFSNSDETPLHLAARNGDIVVHSQFLVFLLSSLLFSLSSPLSHNDNTNTHVQICTMLLGHGQPSSGLSLLLKASQKGLTAAEQAHLRGHHECARALLSLQQELGQLWSMGERAVAI